jgi:drug/metabolite transporter (DMT)-like permease
LIGVIFLGKKIKLNVIIGLVFAIIGLYLLCFSNGISNVYLGDLIVLICGVFFALQIIFVDKYIKDVDAIKLAAYELLVTGILSMILAIIFEKIILKDIFNAILPLLYLGLFSCAIADMFQIIGQKLSNNATIDAIAMSFESVFAVIGGAIILHQQPLLNELIGCIFMFLAIILSQIPISLNKKVLSK